MRDMSAVCRTCLHSVNSCDDARLVPLADTFIAAPTDGRPNSLLECLRYCTQLEVIASGASGVFQYPMQICQRCSKALQVAYHFIRLAKESDETLCTRGALEERVIDDEKMKAPLQPTIDGNNKNDSFPDEVLQTEVLNQSVDLKVSNEWNRCQSVEPFQKDAFTTDVFLHEVECKDQSNSQHTITNEASLSEKKFGNQYILVRNKVQVVQETKELQEAVAENEVTVDNNELICMQCNERFSDVRVLIRHINHHKGITPFRCTSCNYFTCYSESLRKHYKSVHNIEATNEMLDKRINPFIAPVETPFEEMSYFCQKCNFQAHKLPDIKVHIMNEHLVTVDLDIHIRKAFNCPDCHRQFKDQKAMHTHFTLTHGASMGIKKASNDIYICEHCDKQFHFLGSLISHQRVCQLRDAVSCEICSKEFSTMRKFEHHLRHEHAVVIAHECEVCNKTFESSASLQVHRKRHTERHFQCSICQRSYVNGADLKVHVERVHSTVPRALCRICGITFTHIGMLRQHEKKHNQTKFQCRVCEYQCTTRCSLRLHEYAHTGKPYKCATCGRDFSLRANLRRHAKIMHSVDVTDKELGAMFRKKFGYPSRYDAFSKENNSLEITEVTGEDIEKELEEFGLNIDDFMNDLFTGDASYMSDVNE